VTLHYFKSHDTTPVVRVGEFDMEFLFKSFSIYSCNIYCT